MRPVFRATWPTSRVDVFHFSKYDVITWKWRKLATSLILLKYDSPSSPYLKLYAKTGIFMLNLCPQPLICNSEFHQLGKLKDLCNSLGGKIYLLLSHLVAKSRLNLHILFIPITVHTFQCKNINKFDYRVPHQTLLGLHRIWFICDIHKIKRKLRVLKHICPKILEKELRVCTLKL